MVEVSGLSGARAHPHRFRDTFAVELLQNGVSLEDVSKLLGHSSVKITEKHYAPWVKGRQERLEGILDQALENDELGQELKLGLKRKTVESQTESGTNLGLTLVKGVKK
jgi:hypothetical protein